MNKILIGAHVSYTVSEQILESVKQTLEAGATSGAFYVSNSRGYNKYQFNNKKAIEAKRLAELNGLDIKNFIVHSPLVGNIANTDKTKDIYSRTVESYLNDLKTMHKTGLKYFNFHPGSNENKELGIKTIAKGINQLISKTKGHETILLLETMMAKGNYIGRNFEDLKDIISLVKNKSRIGVCLDTCHVWDAGYDIKNNLDGVLDEFDRVIGLEYLKALHINDSLNDIGTHKDRHANIGEGYIGKKALKKLVNHPKLKDLPKALETPGVGKGMESLKKEIKAVL